MAKTGWRIDRLKEIHKINTPLITSVLDGFFQKNTIKA
jgi:hypothetical protein